MSSSNQQGRKCAKCRKLPTEWPCSNFITFEHHERFKALHQSAAAGCPLCRIARQTLIFGAETSQLMATSCPIFVQISGPSNISVALGAGHVSTYGLLEVKEASAYTKSCLVSSSRIRRFRPADQAQELGDVVNLCIRPWIHSCCKGTASIQPSQTAPLPTRVINVESRQEDNVAHLMETNGQRGTYLILSYCWGKGNDRAKTTQNNLGERRRAIQTKDLPLTIRQAIEVTQRLGFRYLWVDAICIVQAHSIPPKYDELEDWRREASKMGQYYRNAALTIAATAATDSEHGFVSERSSQRYPVSPCSVGVWRRDSKPLSEAVIIPGTPSAVDQVHYAPLYSRGWTLQERALSHHILHWCRESVFWECKGRIKASESRPTIQSSSESPNQDTRHIWESALTEPRDNPAYYNELWLDLIEGYCQMHLSYETDRLMAIQGLVHQVPPSSREDDGYVAGLFKPGLVNGLAWCNPTPRAEKVAKFPSWSWASLGAGDLFFRHLDGRFAAVKSVGNFDVAGRDVCSDGRLQLTGPLREIQTSILQKDDGSRFAIIDKTYPFKMYFYFDAIGGMVTCKGSLTLLALGWEMKWETTKARGKDMDTTKKNRLVIGLVLRPTGVKAREHNRIGIFEVLETMTCTAWDHELKEDVEVI